MSKRDKTNAGWRGSPDVWVDAAQDALLSQGVEGVKIAPLGQKLGLSRTSFYWFFEDRDALLAALTDRWRRLNTVNLIGRTEAYADSLVEAVLNVFDCWLDSGLFDPRFEFAMRSWALQDQAIAREIALADDARIRAFAAMFTRFGFDPDLADVRARAMYLVQIGYISMKTEEALALRLTRIREYVRIFTGQDPTEQEIARFLKRHPTAVPPETG